MSRVTNEWCPVLEDERVDPEIHTEYEGVEVYLCCQKCLKQFRANPAAYIGNIPALASPSDARGSQEAEAEHGDHEHEQAAEGDHDSEALSGDVDAEQHDHADHGADDGAGLRGLIQWMGRLHPMIVHFPIALLVMAAVAEVLAILTGGKSLAFAARFCLWGGTLAALVAAPLGWADALSVEDDYTGFSAKLLLIHRWVGVTTALVAALTLYACERSKRTDGESWRRPYRILLFVSTLLVSAAGHLGASLIYGWEYLAW